jgi:hypothetical protein
VWKVSGLVVSFLAVVALALAPRLLADAYVAAAGDLAPGIVVGKREAILMPGRDRTQHVREVTYRYQPVGSSMPETASHQVDQALYGRLRVGSPVTVRYSTWSPLRYVQGVGSVLEDSSWWSRARSGSEDLRTTLEVLWLLGTGLLGYAAYRRNSRALGLVAGLAAAIASSAIVLAGFLVLPILYGMWRRNPGQGYGWLLLGTMIASAALIYERIPPPTPAPAGLHDEAIAIVRHMTIATHIWSDYKSAGQELLQPFAMADLEFTPAGWSEPIYVLDRVDANSVAGLREGATVRVEYPFADPRAARIVGGTRTYADAALLYILGATYAGAAVLAFIVLPVFGAIERRLRASPIFGPILNPAESVKGIANLNPDDPRRKALEAFLRARGK